MGLAGTCVIVGQQALWGGVQDVSAPRADLQAWADYTRGQTRVQLFPGDHFYLVPHRAELVALVARELLRRKDFPIPS